MTSATTGRVVVVSGGAGGVGLAVTQLFAQSGDRVFVVERAETRAQVEALSDPHISRSCMPMCSMRAASPPRIDQIQATGGRLDVLVNVVGGYAAGQPIHELDTRHLGAHDGSQLALGIFVVESTRRGT